MEVLKNSEIIFAQQDSGIVGQSFCETATEITHVACGFPTGRKMGLGGPAGTA